MEPEEERSREKPRETEPASPPVSLSTSEFAGGRCEVVVNKLSNESVSLVVNDSSNSVTGSTVRSQPLPASLLAKVKHNQPDENTSKSEKDTVRVRRNSVLVMIILMVIGYKAFDRALLLMDHLRLISCFCLVLQLFFMIKWRSIGSLSNKMTSNPILVLLTVLAFYAAVAIVFFAITLMIGDDVTATCNLNNVQLLGWVVILVRWLSERAKAK